MRNGQTAPSARRGPIPANTCLRRDKEKKRHAASEIMRNIRNTVLAGLLCLTGGCTYSGSIEQSFYKASSRQDLDSGKIALGAAVVRGPKLQKTAFRAESNGYAGEIADLVERTRGMRVVLIGGARREDVRRQLQHH